MAPALANMRLLQSLMLADNNIEDEGAGALATVVPHMTELRVLNIQRNHISQEGVNALQTAISNHPHSEGIHLNFT